MTNSCSHTFEWDFLFQLEYILCCNPFYSVLLIFFFKPENNLTIAQSVYFIENINLSFTIVVYVEWYAHVSCQRAEHLCEYVTLLLQTRM